MRLIEVGCENLAKHIENVREFGIEPVVAVNQRPEDSAEELALVKRLAGEAGALSAVHNGFGAGGPGAAELAEAVVEACDRPTNFQLLYADDAPFKKKIEAIATRIYGADGVDFAPAAIQRLKEFEAQGLGHFTVCMAKTHLSLSADPNLKGRPRNFRIPVRDVRAYTGAGLHRPAVRRHAADARPRQAGRGLRHRHRQGRQDRRDVLSAWRMASGAANSAEACPAPSGGGWCRLMPVTKKRCAAASSHSSEGANSQFDAQKAARPRERAES